MSPKPKYPVVGKMVFSPSSMIHEIHVLFQNLEGAIRDPISRCRMVPQAFPSLMDRSRSIARILPGSLRNNVLSYPKWLQQSTCATQHVANKVRDSVAVSVGRPLLHHNFPNNNSNNSNNSNNNKLITDLRRCQQSRFQQHATLEYSTP